MGQFLYSSNISIAKLASVFKSTSATYKFYWFWSILQAVENGKTTIKKDELFSRMLTLAWYTVNYFYISFGKQDLIQQAISQIKEFENINIDERQENIFNTLINSTNSKTKELLNHFDKNVPHKFLSPWLGSESKSVIYERSLKSEYNTPYQLFNDHIKISDKWLDYLKVNSGILKMFCYWNLTLYLQSRNPNVPDIPNKIHKPIFRNSLNKHKTMFWDFVINEIGSVNCIYTGKKLVKGQYVIEHFIPFQFVAHDLMWNLIPADSTFNSKKSDKLPQFDIYFESFYNIQQKGVEIIKKNKPKNHFLQDYLPIFPNLEFDKNKFEDHIKPMLTIAHNNGFQYLNQ